MIIKNPLSLPYPIRRKITIWNEGHDVLLFKEPMPDIVFVNPTLTWFDKRTLDQIWESRNTSLAMMPDDMLQYHFLESVPVPNIVGLVKTKPHHCQKIYRRNGRRTTEDGESLQDLRLSLRMFQKYRLYTRDEAHFVFDRNDKLHAILTKI